MPGAAEVRIRGQAELERAFLEVRRDVLVELKPAIAEIANVVKSDAQRRAIAGISNMGSSRWSRMRLGITLKAVYVAPASKRRGGSPRSNLGGELMEAMQGALDAHQTEVVARISALCDVTGARHGFL